MSWLPETDFRFSQCTCRVDNRDSSPGYFVYNFFLKSQIFQSLQAADVLDAALLSSVKTLKVDYSITRVTNSVNVL